MTENDVLSIVSSTIHEAFPVIKVYKEELPQGAELPVFYIYVVGSVIDRVLGDRYCQKFDIAVKFFSDTKENEDCYSKAAVLIEKLRCMTYQSKTIKGKGMGHRAEEGVLHFNFKAINTACEISDNSKLGDLEVNIDGE